MINIPKNLIKSVIDGTERPSLLETYVMNNFSMGDIIKSFCELLIINESLTRQPITVTEDEYNSIISLFKVRGQRTMEDGSVILETRGRPSRKKKGE